MVSTNGKHAVPKKRKTVIPPVPSVPPHPLGIKPLGNQLFACVDPEYVDTRTKGLGPFAVFDDAFLLAFLVQYLDDPKILCALAAVSKVWYAFWHYEAIWKGWTLEKWRNMPAHSPKKFLENSWRKTFAYLTTGRLVPEVLQPCQIPHLYSDLLYQPYLYAFVPLSHLVDMLEAFSNMKIVKHLQYVDSPSPPRFEQLYEVAPGRPCILQNCMKEWSALQEWTWDVMDRRFGDVALRAEAVDLKLRDYLAYMRSNPADEIPMYLFDKDYPKQGALGAELAAGFQVPACFTADLFSVLGETRPDFNWLIIGPERSGSSHHKDPNATSAWNAVIRGAKLWILYPPDVVPPGVFPSDDGANVSTPISLMDWWLNWFPQTRQLMQGLPEDKAPVWGICREGEIMFVPSGWWHTVINLEPSVAITQNYVSKSNLQQVLSFLYCKRDMISGYGDADDAVCVGESSPSGAASRKTSSRELYESFASWLRSKRRDDAQLMKILDDFEAANQSCDVKQPKTTNIWNSIAKSACEFSLFGE